MAKVRRAVPLGNVRVSATKVGAWKEARAKLTALKDTYPEVSAIIHAEAYRSLRRIKRKIRNGEFNLPELSDATVASRGSEVPILIDSGQYIDSMKVRAAGGGLWAIGVPSSAKNDEGDSLGQIGMWLEYGTINMPPRPHWRPEYTTFKGEVTKAVNAYLLTQT